MNNDQHHFEFSDYTQTFFLHSNLSKRVLEKIIDKCQSNIRRKFIDLKPNVFSSLRKENSLKRQQKLQSCKKIKSNRSW